MTSLSPPLPPEDLEHIFHHAGGCWNRLEGKRVLFTGASGFFGSWMLESYLYAGTKSGLPFRAIAVTRDARRFSEYLPHLAGDPRVEILESDAATMAVPEGPVDYVVHSLFAPAPLEEMEAHYELATRRLLEIAALRSSAGCLLCSTGAVYKPSRSPILENWPRFGAGDPLSYPRIRAQVEDQWEAGFARSGLPVTIARGFAFVGPRLPLDGQFAVGNFLRDVLSGRPVIVHGDGSPIRSYLHAADLAVRLWHILVHGQPGGTYNVGAAQELSIGDVAAAVAALVQPTAEVRILRERSGFSYYVPDITRIEQAFRLAPDLPFPEALARTWRWLRASAGH
ncbi:MAG: NAD-dependent epimerase/dehydratase family protein [Verrucomicrobia bacterium]|nr:NAD-dependent epimerase/dehydratase family protein [Verrucomicrobiota bacterium]